MLRLRHTTPKITLELYAQPVSADQQGAHNKAVRMVLASGNPGEIEGRYGNSVETRVSLALGVRGCPEINPAEIS